MLKSGVRMLSRLPFRLLIVMLAGTSVLRAGESLFLYGIHDHEPVPEEYVNHIRAGVPTVWVTSTMAIGHDPSDQSGYDFSWFANNGCTVICRLNNGHFPDGTIPRPADYAAFAQRCANFVRNSKGCEIWLIGNETNIAASGARTHGSSDSMASSWTSADLESGIAEYRCAISLNSLPDRIYVQDLDRAGGMRVNTTGVAEGSLVDLAGYLTTVDGERRLTVYEIASDGTSALSPLGLPAKPLLRVHSVCSVGISPTACG